MGTDIHAIVQYKPSSSDGWKTATFPNRWFGRWDDEKEKTLQLRIDRNYNLFAVLGDVRNGTGFAGCNTGDGFNTILFESRGLPEDMGDLTLDEEGYAKYNTADGYDIWLGDHSYNWLYLSEVEQFNFEQRTKLRGFISHIERIDMLSKESDAPLSWCGGVSGLNVQHITIQEMDERISSKRLYPGTSYYALYEWGQTYREAIGEQSLDSLLSTLRTIRDERVEPTFGWGERVRLVFGFDS